MTGPRLKPPVSDRDHIQGKNDAPVTLVEFGDYECSHCGRAYGVIKQLQEALGDQLRFVFRNFPLAQLHSQAEIAAEAAEAAGAQGKFWEMHDLLYENQEALEPENLASYAASLGVNMSQSKYADRIAEDRRSGLRSGVNGTPTFFINGVRHNGPWDFEVLLNAIKVEIAGGRREAV